MKIRLGYVAISKAIENVTTSSTITYTNFVKEKEPYDKLYRIIEGNLEALREILIYNIKNKLHFYRLTSKLIPLATHDKVNYDYITPFKNRFNEIGQLIEKNKIRIDVHPDQYAVLNSVNNEVVINTMKILEYHYNVLEALNIKNKIIILHVGGNNFGKEKSIKRFINNFNKLPDYLKSVIAVENDDKIFNLDDVLFIADQLNIPVVLDYHHFLCNNSGKKIENYIEKVFLTWNGRRPKIHFSSPKSKLKKDFRAHHDYIDVDTFIDFIKKVKFLNIDFDIMIEAKAKDDALYRLVRQLKYKTNFVFLDESTLEVYNCYKEN